MIATMQKWSTHGAPYMGRHFDNCYVLYTQSRDADILTQSNWRTIINYLDEKNVKYSIVGFSHWLCGYLDQILINENDQHSVNIGNEIIKKLSEYPIFNEDDFFCLESEKASELLQEIRKDIDNLDPDEELKGWLHIDKTMTDEQIIGVIYEYGMVTQ